MKKFIFLILLSMTIDASARAAHAKRSPARRPAQVNAGSTQFLLKVVYGEKSVEFSFSNVAHKNEIVIASGSRKSSVVVNEISSNFLVELAQAVKATAESPKKPCSRESIQLTVSQGSSKKTDFEGCLNDEGARSQALLRMVNLLSIYL